MNTMFRWLIFLPASLIGAYLIQVIATALATFSLSFVFTEPDSLASRLFVPWLGNILFGASLVYIGTRIAPTHKVIVALSLTGVLLVFLGLVIGAAYLFDEYSAWNVGKRHAKHHLTRVTSEMA